MNTDAPFTSRTAAPRRGAAFMLAGALLPWVVWVVLLATFVLFASTTSRALLDERPTARFREFRGVAVGP